MWKELKCPLTVEWINKNKVYICNRVLFNLKEERPPIKRDDLGELRGYEGKWDKPATERSTIVQFIEAASRMVVLGLVLFSH